MGFPGGVDDKDLPQCRGPGFDPWVGKSPWRREWLPTPVFLLENSMDRTPWLWWATAPVVTKSQT